MFDYKYDNINNIKINVIEAFVGTNVSSFITKWEKIYFEQKIIQINWYALFFPFFWYGYRKMNFYFFLLLIVSSVLNLIPHFRNSIYFQFMSLIFLSGLSYIMYFLKLENLIKKAKTENIPEEYIIHYVAQKGGVSVIGGVISTLITICYIIVLFYLR